MTEGTAETLRAELVAGLSDVSERVRVAVEAVPRHLFLPVSPLALAYADMPVVTKARGALALSGASAPSIVGMMLDQAGIRPGQSVLEVGTGTGWNAGLLGHLVGDGGRVTTVEADAEVAESACGGLGVAGCRNVEVVVGDGTVGYESGAPYDAVVVTAAVWDVPQAWFDQLVPGGLLVLPLRVCGNLQRCVAFERQGDCWRGRSVEVCGFMPLRGQWWSERRLLRLSHEAHGANLAYLARRPLGQVETFELGVCGYGRDGDWLAGRVGDLIVAWDRMYRSASAPVIEAHPGGTASFDGDRSRGAGGVFWLAGRRGTPLSVTWPSGGGV